MLAAAQTSECGRSAIEHELEIRPPNEEPTPHLSLADALDILAIPSVSIAVIERNELRLVCAFGHDASVDSLYQAASMSKLVTAVTALRLVEQGRLSLDADIDTELRTWHLPASDLTKDHAVTLRGLLSMTGGIGVPGFSGYEPGDVLPSLNQILDGAPPAHSPPVRVEYVPGSRYAYSGGGYEIVQALIQDASGEPFVAVPDDLVLKPLGMASSLFAQPLPPDRLAHAAMGHHGDGDALPGGSRLIPEIAAGGLWSTPSDLARLLIDLAASYRGEQGHLLKPATAQAMFAHQNGGSYGLGGAIVGSGHSLVLMKRGQNVGFQGYLLIYPETGQGIVVMTDSDHGTTLAEALIRRAAAVYRWPPLDDLAD
ncbi:MAG TPA: serine hydrolase domain-containing protein [Dongiaceae bacterium]